MKDEVKLTSKSFTLAKLDNYDPDVTDDGCIKINISGPSDVDVTDVLSEVTSTDLIFTNGGYYRYRDYIIDQNLLKNQHCLVLFADRVLLRDL